jgi:hypothetical protein
MKSLAMGREAAITDMGFKPRDPVRCACAACASQERGVVPAVAANPKGARALARLHDGQILYQLESGQWWFRGNKFLPESVARQLPLERSHLTNTGSVAYRLKQNSAHPRTPV